jgi:threonine/homoserine/homoserine lactone efflux protein
MGGVEFSTVLGFVVACVVLNVVPGPGMVFILAHSVAGGRRTGVTAAAGIAAGTVLHVAAACAGLTALLVAAPAALDVVRVGGAVVLLYLAVSNLRAARAGRDEQPPARRSARRTFVSAVLSNLGNPKVALFYIAFVPQFLTAGGWATWVQVLVLGGLQIVVGFGMDVVLAVAAGSFSAVLLGRPSVQQWLRRAAAAVFGGLALRLLLSDTL